MKRDALRALDRLLIAGLLVVVAIFTSGQIFSGGGGGWFQSGTTTRTQANITQALLPDGLGSAPAVAYLSEPGLGFYRSAPATMNLRVATGDVRLTLSSAVGGTVSVR
ncbi:MAG TPA: hypothetical protein VGR44_12065, partial [Methylomirabilota bacterium]|nr:hypothetical protein [Methylomirabilota bacterium]